MDRCRIVEFGFEKCDFVEAHSRGVCRQTSTIPRRSTVKRLQQRRSDHNHHPNTSSIHSVKSRPSADRDTCRRSAWARRSTEDDACWCSTTTASTATAASTNNGTVGVIARRTDSCRARSRAVVRSVGGGHVCDDLGDGHGVSAGRS